MYCIKIGNLRDLKNENLHYSFWFHFCTYRRNKEMWYLFLTYMYNQCSNIWHWHIKSKRSTLEDSTSSIFEWRKCLLKNLLMGDNLLIFLSSKINHFFLHKIYRSLWKAEYLHYLTHVSEWWTSSHLNDKCSVNGRFSNLVQKRWKIFCSTVW